MLSMFCFAVAGTLIWWVLTYKSPIVVFMGVTGLSADLAFASWAVGEDLKGVSLFLLVSGSLMSVFGFLLCLIPWQIGTQTKDGLGSKFFLVFAYGMAIWDKDLMVASTNLSQMDSGLSWGICALMGLLLFFVMVLVVSLAPIKGGALRRFSVIVSKNAH